MSERLHPDDVQAIALAVVALLPEQPAATAATALIDAAEVARRFGVSAEWARDHSEDLGAVRLGDGPRPRLRFDPARVSAALTGRSAGERSGLRAESAPAPNPPRRTRRRSGSVLDTLPVRELQPRPVTTNRPGGAGTPRATAHEECTS